ncbi:signal transduction histidine kinase [Streptomyces sp. V3I8]|jgi:signal transduction histidine kinase|uniref:sensor histidine kinase n=1 Tax=Streptomyces sp. V3I8 TaxID=3042279 RepID=UPI00278B9C1A|nr:sensor histidine kinase [Streptomyces sp. V3I8]MDQ1041763.1 signal transduction histidine kinase [Streptomyces sp. V3I8]
MDVRAGVAAAARGACLALLSMVVSLVLFCLSVVSIALSVVGIGVFTTPWVIGAARANATARRRLAGRWCAVDIAVPYRPLPADAGGVVGQVQRWRWLLKDPATWRDLLWMIVDPVAGFVLGMFAAALLLYGVWGFVLAAGVWRPMREVGYWYAFVPVGGQLTALAAAVLGAGFIAAGLRYDPLILHVHGLLTRAFLAPGRGRALQMRIEHLKESRADAVDVSAAELRRIERDLHDGAQARLVAMGMSLGTIEHLLRSDPDQAAVLLAQTRKSSAEALDELRQLVRGIHPPVLAERGLGDAVRALALRSPVRTEVGDEVIGRLAAPVEAAAYFSVSEMLTNVAKHARAERIWIDMRCEEGMLRITVTDDGRGGADPAGGSGLAGIERRLGAFDGILALHSPPGGPTTATIELPCEQLAPQINPS